MSRIGKKPVVVPAGVTVTVGADNVVSVKGPRGELKQHVDRDIKVEVKGAEVELAAPLIRFGTRHCMDYTVP